jgi:hypothetical protein
MKNVSMERHVRGIRKGLTYRKPFGIRHHPALAVFYVAHGDSIDGSSHRNGFDILPVFIS